MRGRPNDIDLLRQGSLRKLSPTFRVSTTSNSELMSTRSSTKTLPLTTGSPRDYGLIDTSVAVDSGGVAAVGDYVEVAISALTLAELAAGLHAASDSLTRTRRQRHLRRLAEESLTLPFDANCAYAWGRIYTAVKRVGRKPRGSRALDLMIAATALAYCLPLYTMNADDLRGLEALIEIVDIGS